MALAKKKRQITERRRAQGRAAQKAYREKRKQRALLAVDPESKQVNASCTCSIHGPSVQTVVTGHGNAFNSDPSSLDGVPGLDSTDLQSWSGDMGMYMTPKSIEADLSSLLGISRPAGQLDTRCDSPQSFSREQALAPAIPLDSYIRVRRYSFHAASIENAIILGFTFDQLKDHKCGHDRIRSPWITPLLYSTFGEAIPAPDLSPGDAQKTYDHDLYIDCLPFRDFREKLLALRSVEPKIFNEDEFIQDIDYRDAMQCWGPTPWEDRSWEVQDWFLKKWWMITGGENGIMGSSSRWWRSLRGELD